MKKIIILIVSIILLAFVIWTFLSSGKKEQLNLENKIESNKDGIAINNNVASTNPKMAELAINESSSKLISTNTSTSTNAKINNINKNMNTVTMKTNKGIIVIELNAQAAPNTVENFIKLANDKFYDGVKFHRVISGFMIQAGDPNSKNDNAKETWGMGGPGYKFADEIVANSKVKDIYINGYKRGVVAMANSGPNTNGSQFFIMHSDYPLPPSYTIFGKVTNGLDIVDAIAASPKDRSDKPLENIIIESVIVK
jgi:cyclophilin family peptidyl-prolyl cis-trans isomerase